MKVPMETDKGIRLREPSAKDGAGIWDLVKSTGVLDVNSPYSYIMLCDYFKDTCLVAEDQGRIIAFVSAFLSPAQPDTLFVWQIASAHTHRGRGLGKALLSELFMRQKNKGIRFIEATISPSNVPSNALFRSFAKQLGANHVITERYPGDLFPGAAHEEEKLFRIGPIPYATSNH